MRSYLTLRTLPLVLALAAAPLSSAIANGPYSLKEGKTLAGLRLPALSDGAMRSFDDFRGKKTVLHVFASW